MELNEENKKIVMNKSESEISKAIVKMKAPTDVAAVERLQGTVTYLARYVPKLSEVMRPITILTHKDVEWSWGEAQDKAFRKLKKLLTESTILAYYDRKGRHQNSSVASGDFLQRITNVGW